METLHLEEKLLCHWSPERQWVEAQHWTARSGKELGVTELSEPKTNGPVFLFLAKGRTGTGEKLHPKLD